MKTVIPNVSRNKNVFYKIILVTIFMAFLLYGCSNKNHPSESSPSTVPAEDNSLSATTNKEDADSEVEPSQKSDERVINPIVDEVISDSDFSFINSSGNTLQSRINTPPGYERISSQEGEFTSFMRNLKLKENGSKVLLYDGKIKQNQNNHIAVFDLDIGNRDLQQCADSVMRVYAEYYWSLGAYDKIAFHLTNGFFMEYSKWRDGYRIIVEGNDVRWSKTKTYDDSYETFRKYLDMVFSYAGTLSLSQESTPITIDEILPGDMFLQGGSPGHCVLIVDVAEDMDGNRSFLLAQGYMPAQDFHILINPLHPEDPWYYELELTYPLQTPSWTFEEDTLVRWSDFPLAQASATSGSNSRRDKDASYPVDMDRVIPVMSDKVKTIADTDVNKVTLLAVGDNLIHIEVVQSGKQEDGSYRYDHLYDRIKEDIEAADIAVINQETILGGAELGYSGYPNFNSPTQIGDAIVNAGFDVVLHATNHTMDKGKKAVMNTFSFWDKYPFIKVLGINKSQKDQETIPIVEKNGIKIAMLNYTFSLNGHKLPKDMPWLVNMLDKAQMSADIKKAKELADFVIVFPHWGSEYVYEATKSQKDLTDFYYQLGVDLVIGAHPHVLQPVEWIETDENHRMLVYYSLGNFLSYQKEAPRMLGGMANITIIKEDNETYISDAGIIPIVTHYEHGPADYNYDVFKLTDYTVEQASLHGVSDIARQGAFIYEETYTLAEKVLGSWFPIPLE
ncbi:CapA family protein [Mobilitalea sibirica]|uniref:CapA family protein n=1 Tax=Mobilitalea sibirica TaxID=1462919 RepID=A0A8J7HCI2_9FIRM|nr:DUF4846 domain-containing protein [Mobilitalea sibirica]MBH1941002.1 CapA family protein [Mobilitalea sibirica]